MKDISDEVPGLSEAERAFEITEGQHVGERVKVRVTRKSDPDAGVGETRFLGLKVQAFLLDDQGGVATRDEGVPIQTAAFGRTIQVAALDEGSVQLPNEIAEATREAVEKMKNHLTALEAWAVVPAEKG